MSFGQTGVYYRLISGAFVTMCLRRLSDADRGRVLAGLNNGVAMLEVARRLAMSHSVIQRPRDRFANTGSVAERRHAGQPGSTTRHQDRVIALTSLRNKRHRKCTEE